MPEIPSSRKKFLIEAFGYMVRFPLIKLSSMTGMALTRPICAGLVLTSKCNLECPFCFLDTTSEFANKLTQPELMGLIDDLAGWGVRQLTLSGGEPILEEGLFDIIKHAKGRGMTVGFTTNGTLLSKDMVKKIDESGVDRVSVSLCGLKATHDELYGPGNFKKAMSGFKALSSLDDLKLRINTIVLGKNVGELKDLFYLAKSHNAEFNMMPLGVDHITAVKKREITSEILDKLWVKDENLDMLDSTLDELKKMKHKQGVLITSDSFLELMKSYYRDPSYVDRNCKIATYSIGFAGNGDVVVCGPLGVIGNIRDATPKQIWGSQSFRKARLKMKSCKKCLFNCQYTPSTLDLLKDFGIYPILRKIRI